MAQLAHVMETLLDHLRDGSVSVSTPVVDALLGSLDMLRIMKDDLANGTETPLDISAAVSSLEAAVGDIGQPPKGHREPALRTTISLDTEERSRLEAALDGEFTAYQISVSISRESSWAAVQLRM